MVLLDTGLGNAEEQLRTKELLHVEEDDAGQSLLC